MSAIILVGMPGAGKSTLGVLLAKKLGRAFIDTDLLIQQQQGKLLQTIVDEQGYLALREIEAQVLQGMTESDAVIATGGSAVYSAPAMQHLKRFGTVVYLRLSLQQLAQRNLGLADRGLACPPGQDLNDIYKERCPLYETFADIIVDMDDGVDASLITLLKSLEKQSK